MENKLGIVRIINSAPFDKIIKPISEEQYLRRMSDASPITTEINRMLRSSGKVQYYDGSLSPEAISIRDQNAEVKKAHLPLSGAYNSMTLWTINGPMVDENESQGTAFTHNTYSDRNVAIIDNLEPHIDEIASCCPIDFAIHGKTKLSKNGKIVVTKQYFDNLPQDKKEIITKDEQFLITDKPITESVNETLLSMGIQPEQLSLDVRTNKGFVPSNTSENVIKEIDKLSKEHDIPNVQHSNLLQKQFDPHHKLEFAEAEFENMDIVDTFYQRSFMLYMSQNYNLDPATLEMCLYMPSSEEYVSNLFDDIKAQGGIDKFKSVVDEYNAGLISLAKQGKLPTAQTVVDKMSLPENQNSFNLEESLANKVNELSNEKNAPNMGE